MKVRIRISNLLLWQIHLLTNQFVNVIIEPGKLFFGALLPFTPTVFTAAKLYKTYSFFVAGSNYKRQGE